MGGRMEVLVGPRPQNKKRMRITCESRILTLFTALDLPCKPPHDPHTHCSTSGLQIECWVDIPRGATAGIRLSAREMSSDKDFLLVALVPPKPRALLQCGLWFMLGCQDHLTGGCEPHGGVACDSR